jgi:hypothetical protein
MIAAGDISGQITLWNVSEGKVIRSWTAHQDAAVKRLMFSLDGKLLGSVSSDIGMDDGPGHSEVKVWSLRGTAVAALR